MAKRERQNELKIYLSDDEQYILEQKWKEDFVICRIRRCGFERKNSEISVE